MAPDPLASLRDAPTDRPFVVAQLGQSLDGRIATPTGASRYINGACALDHLHRLRAHVDAVLVGVGTVVADDPALTVRRVEGRNPARVFIDPNGRLPPDAKCVTSDCADRFVIRALPGPSNPGLTEILVGVADGIIPPSAIVAALFERGMRRILVEGGARTISSFIAAGCIDRLHVLVAPMIIGSGVPGLVLPPIDGLEDALRPAVDVHLFPDGDVLFDCHMREENRAAR
ncbi:RibD family protein [Microvirga antarctica]|uniref:RibD family protein n=1 Tax=Microvirga antarctica TaxID=2819233 RepID=UPI001FE9B5C0|nr:RibD family protein [Microvirga antarctica]